MPSRPTQTMVTSLEGADELRREIFARREDLRASLAMLAMLELERFFERHPKVDAVVLARKEGTGLDRVYEPGRILGADGRDLAASDCGMAGAELRQICEAMPDMAPYYAMPRHWRGFGPILCERADPLADLGVGLLGPERFAAWRAERERQALSSELCETRAPSSAGGSTRL